MVVSCQLLLVPRMCGCESAGVYACMYGFVAVCVYCTRCRGKVSAVRNTAMNLQYPCFNPSSSQYQMQYLPNRWVYSAINIYWRTWFDFSIYQFQRRNFVPFSLYLERHCFRLQRTLRVFIIKLTQKVNLAAVCFISFRTRCLSSLFASTPARDIFIQFFSRYFCRCSVLQFSLLLFEFRLWLNLYVEHWLCIDVVKRETDENQ